ncbi:MAG TPA: GNAT family N-acetyltransferase [Cyclobacteriaceae bacterium]|nr:GNAT family N-acetyltransferase [Cyclobacteriaceae bacterium]
MKSFIVFKDILIRTELMPGDLGYVIHLHGKLYKKEYNYGLHFESYVASGLHEFYESMASSRSCAWVCENKGKVVGFVALMDRGEQAQLRYFIIDPPYRGVGLGGKLMELYIDYLKRKGFKGSYLLTTKELPAAAHLYTGAGFQLKEEKPAHHPFGKDVIEQRYELELI